MAKHRVVSGEEWLAARRQLLAKEKEFTRLRDQLSQLRRDLPWERVEKDYVFTGPDGPIGLGDLFAGRSQLIVYHFMFDPLWSEGCKSCSFWADNFEGFYRHLHQRDVTLVAVSRAPGRRSNRSSGGWGGASCGCPRPAAISISTFGCRFGRRSWRPERSNTILPGAGRR